MPGARRSHDAGSPAAAAPLGLPPQTPLSALKGPRPQTPDGLKGSGPAPTLRTDTTPTDGPEAQRPHPQPPNKPEVPGPALQSGRSPGCGRPHPRVAVTPERGRRTGEWPSAPESAPVPESGRRTREWSAPRSAVRTREAKSLRTAGSAGVLPPRTRSRPRRQGDVRGVSARRVRCQVTGPLAQDRPPDRGRTPPGAAPTHPPTAPRYARPHRTARGRRRHPGPTVGDTRHPFSPPRPTPHPPSKPWS